MKKLFNLLLISLSLLAFAACNDDNQDNDSGHNGGSSEQNNKNYAFIGTIEVSNGYMQDSVEMNVCYDDSLSMHIFSFKEISFSAKMPHVQDVQFRFNDYVIQNNDTIYQSDTIVPYWRGSQIDFMTLTDFHALVTKDSLVFTSNGGEGSSEGVSTITYKGKRQ